MSNCETDNVIGSADYDQIHSKGLLHRFISIFVLDTTGRLFIQRRANFETPQWSIIRISKWACKI
jgi:isopentenyldiphosphate isomerase